MLSLVLAFNSICLNCISCLIGVMSMKIIATITTAVLGLPLLFSGVAVAESAKETQNELTYLYVAAQSDPAIKDGYQALMKPLLDEYAWLSAYGTTTPGVVESLDDKNYEIYWGCKPHDCVVQSYAVMYDPEEKEMVAGAFVENSYDDNLLLKAEIFWLGHTDLDKARVLGKYLY